LPDAEQLRHAEELSRENFFFRDRFQKHGLAGLDEGGGMKLLLIHHLEEQWKLTAEIPFEKWQQESGCRIEETASGPQVINPASGPT
jgi:hypothetical protein